MKRTFHILLLTLVFLSVASVNAAVRHTVSGTVTDVSSGETLIGATVYDSISGKGAVTNAYGFFSLVLPDGRVSIKVSYVGCQPQTFDFRLTKDTVINVKLQNSVSLKEVVVKAHREHDQIGRDLPRQTLHTVRL